MITWEKQKKGYSQLSFAEWDHEVRGWVGYGVRLGM